MPFSKIGLDRLQILSKNNCHALYVGRLVLTAMAVLQNSTEAPESSQLLWIRIWSSDYGRIVIHNVVTMNHFGKVTWRHTNLAAQRASCQLVDSLWSWNTMNFNELQLTIWTVQTLNGAVRNATLSAEWTEIFSLKIVCKRCNVHWTYSNKPNATVHHFSERLLIVSGITNCDYNSLDHLNRTFEFQTNSCCSNFF